MNKDFGSVNIKPIDLRYCMQTAYEEGIKMSPRSIIHKLNIQFKKWIPQTLGDQIWLLDCTNIPNPLPKYVTVIEWPGEKERKHWVK